MRYSGVQNRRKILCVFARYVPVFANFYHSYQFFPDTAAFMTPQGILTIAAYLPEEWEVRVVDENIHPIEDADLAWADAVAPGTGSRLRGVDQVHGAEIVRADSLRDGRRVEADGVVATSPHDVAVVLAADCAPVWLIDSANSVIALIHAGWRGVVAGVIESGVRACVENGASPEHLVAAVGPHLQACC